MPRWLRLAGRIAGVLLMLILVAAAVGYGVTERRVHAKYAVATTPVHILHDSATLARGKHLAMSIGKCVDCHGENFAGLAIFHDPMFGHMFSSNLTNGDGGIGAQYTDAELVRVIRRGVKRDGTSVLFMPVTDYTHFTDTDAAAIVAYLRSLPPVDHVPGTQSLGPIARMLVLNGTVPVILPASHIAEEVARPVVAAGPTLEYGRYLTRVGGCFGCHGDKLAGGPVPGGPPSWPPAANLTPAALGQWTEADFTRALREGVRPDHRVLSAVMPWKYTRLMTDDEIHAVWLYLQSVPAVSKQS